MLERPPHHAKARGIHVSASVVIEGFAITSQHAPSRIVRLQVFKRPPHLGNPLFGQNYVLVAEDDYFVKASVDGIIVRLRRRTEILLEQNLMIVWLTKAR